MMNLQIIAHSYWNTKQNGEYTHILKVLFRFKLAFAWINTRFSTMHEHISYMYYKNVFRNIGEF